MNTAMDVSNILRILSALFLIGYGHPLNGFPLRYGVGNTYRYSYVTMTSSGNSAATALGFSIHTTVHITPVWSSGSTVLVKLSIVSPELRSRSRVGELKALQALPRLPVYFTWTSGRVEQVLVSREDSTLTSNIKRGIISLFQLRIEDATHTEIDSSGECDVNYVTSRVGGTTVTKTKTNCKNLDLVGKYSQANELLGVSVTSLSTVKYDVIDDVIQKAEAVEKWTSAVNLQRDIAAHIHASQNLTYIDVVKSSESIQASSLEKAIEQINKGSSNGFHATTLGSTFESRQCSVTECRSVGDIVREYRAKLGPDAGGKEHMAELFVELVGALRRGSSNEGDVYKLLADKSNSNIIMTLIDAAGAAQTDGSLAALIKYLKFNVGADFDKCERFLLAAALSTHPSSRLLQHLHKLQSEKIGDERLRESISESLGAVIRTFQKQSNVHQQSDKQLLAELEQSLIKTLHACTDSTCRLIMIRTLSNAQLASTLPSLVKLALSGADASVSEAALKAIARFNCSLINNPQMKRDLLSVLYETRRRFDSAARSQALNVLLQCEVLDVRDVTNILKAATDPLNAEFNTYILAKLFNTAQRNQALKKLLNEAMKNTQIANYNNLALRGKSLAFTSLLSDMPEMTYHMYVENSRSGLMKRSGMDISITGADPSQTLPVYNFAISAAGLEGMLGDGAESTGSAAEVEEEVRAGMSLDMIGSALRPITFFTGQAGLMSAVWNAPSEPISALQVNFLLQDHSERVHLHNGLVAELTVLGSVSLDLSGSLSVSLWNKNAQSLIKNSAGISIVGSFEVTTTSFRLGSEVKVVGGSCIDFRTDVDFYDGVKMCLQMSRPPFIIRHNTTSYESSPGLSKSLRRTTSKRLSITGLSYPLPASNSAQCRIMYDNNS